MHPSGGCGSNLGSKGLKKALLIKAINAESLHATFNSAVCLHSAHELQRNRGWHRKQFNLTFTMIHFCPNCLKTRNLYHRFDCERSTGDQANIEMVLKNIKWLDRKKRATEREPCIQTHRTNIFRKPEGWITYTNRGDDDRGRGSDRCWSKAPAR